MQISTTNLRAERDALRNQLAAANQQVITLQEALDQIDTLITTLEGSNSFPALGEIGDGTTISDAVKRVCADMVDGITRQRVFHALKRDPQFSHVKENTVSASLASWAAQGKLKVVEQGKGRSPTYYTTHPANMPVNLNEEQITLLKKFADNHSNGGWQTLYRALLSYLLMDCLWVSPSMRQKILLYMAMSGTGSWQNGLKKILGEGLPHLFKSFPDEPVSSDQT